MAEADLGRVKQRRWFYEFDLPDGTRTETDIHPDVLRIHTSRREKLRQVIQQHVGDASRLSAIDFASHEGYYSLELAAHFGTVRGLEIRPESLAAAQLISDTLGVRNISYILTDLTKMPFDPTQVADFVLLYGLLYHLEAPVQLLRLASQLARRHILIETQVFPYDVSGRLEDGHYTSQRAVEGVFSLSLDYASQREGGSSNIALVPSLNALVFLLRNFGFNQVEVLPPAPDDYEQFRRGARVVVYGRK